MIDHGNGDLQTVSGLKSYQRRSGYGYGKCEGFVGTLKKSVQEGKSLYGNIEYGLPSYS